MIACEVPLGQLGGRVLGICGTPRTGGNSEVLLGHALAPFSEAGWQVDTFLLSQARVGPCTGCEGCRRGDGCVQADDMRSLYRGFSLCDALIVSTPVYYRNVSAQLKAVFDRTYATSSSRPLAGKAAGAIAVGRGSGGGQSLALSVICNYLLSSGAICVPGELNGVSAVADAPGEVASQPERLRQARVLGQNVLHHARMMRACLM